MKINQLLHYGNNTKHTDPTKRYLKARNKPPMMGGQLFNTMEEFKNKLKLEALKHKFN